MLEAIIALVTLTAMEIVLGIDNIIFIAIVAGKLPPHQQPRARRLGLAAALITRLLRDKSSWELVRADRLAPRAPAGVAVTHAAAIVAQPISLEN